MSPINHRAHEYQINYLIGYNFSKIIRCFFERLLLLKIYFDAAYRFATSFQFITLKNAVI